MSHRRTGPAASTTPAQSCLPPGGVLVGTTDGASAQLLQAEGAVLIDLRAAAAFTRGHLPGAVHRSQAITWRSALAARPGGWALLYGGTDISSRRFVRVLPDGRPALRVELAAPTQSARVSSRRGTR